MKILAVECNDEQLLRITALIGDKFPEVAVKGALSNFLTDLVRETSILESEEKFSKIVHTSSYPILIIDTANGCLAEVNDAMVANIGFSREELIGHNPVELGIISPETQNRSRQIIEEKGSYSGLEVYITTKAGEIRSGLVSGQIIVVKDHAFLIQTIIDITERNEIQEKVQLLLADKELLLKEVHHRIKNNMNTIYGFLVLQAGTLNDPGAVAALEDAGNRVRSMMLLYSKLYQFQNFQSMNASHYLPALIDEIMENFPNSQKIAVRKKIVSVELDHRVLQPLGIIIYELLSNIMKYAFAGRNEGEIYISVSMEGEVVSVEIADNGNGLPESVDFSNSTGFGLVLVDSLSKQLNAAIRIERRNGTRIILEFER